MAQSVQVFLSHSSQLQRELEQSCTIIASAETTTQEFIQLSLQQLQVYEDTSFYELREQFTTESSNPGRVLSKDERPVTIQNKWLERRWRGDMKLCLRRRSEDVAMARLLRNLSPDVDNHLTADMCNLTELSESAMLKTLRTRFEHSKIYTYVGSILIAVNPYFFYPIYNPTYIQEYQSVKLGELPPHIFAIADDTYNSMLSSKQDQSVIISGESGAGKTESTKFLLHHILNLSAKFEEGSTLEMITLGTGPVLEAFGNALTVSNNNSSRFGKFILVRFRENGAYYNASIQQYLLEKSRIVLQARHERNYHIFYYMLAGASSSLCRRLSLKSVKDYCYLSQGVVPLGDVCEVDEFHRLKRSLAMLGLAEELQNSLFSILAAILHLGNIEFFKEDTEEGGGNCRIQTPENLTLVSKLLKVDESTLKQALVTRKSWAGGSEFVVAYKCEQATYTRDAMAKALYGALFDWIVEQVNVALGGGRSRHRHRGNTIGVLDIFGFEVYEQNSFEQFCINYANEQLQQYFNKHVFKSEQEEYMREGIVWDAVSFTDNSVCLELIAKKPAGLLYLLDEECSFPGADDNSLFLKFQQQHKKHSHFKCLPVKQSEPLFIIVHYAGDVLYQVKGFREKNTDLMRQDIVEVLKTSKQNLVRALIGLPSVAAARWRRVRTLLLATAIFKEEGRLLRKRSNKSNSLTRLKTGTLNGMEFRLSGTPLKVPKNQKRITSPPKTRHESSPGQGDRSLKRRLAYSPARAQRRSKACTLAAGRKKGPAPTVSAQFHHSLLSLMDMLEQTKPYFIRCIKSNATKTPCHFDNSVVLRQLRYTGMLQTIRIRKSGYSVRMSFGEFYEKYHFLMGAREPDLPSQIKCFLEGWGISVCSNEAQIGKTKVFMHEEHAHLLQQRLQEEVLDRIIMIQKWTRGNLARMRFLNMRRSALVLQCHIRGWISRLRYNDLRRQVSAAVVIQAWWRRVTCRRAYLAVRRIAVATQAWWRGRLARQRYAEMMRDRPHPASSVYKPGVVRRNSLSEVSLQLSETVSPSILPEVCRPTVGRSFSEDPQPPSPLRRRWAQKERSGNSPKRMGIQISQSSKPTSPTNQKSFEYSNSLPNSKASADQGKRTSIPTHPISRSSICQETPLPSPHDARSNSLPGATASDQPPEKSSKKRTPGRRRSKKMNKWTAKGAVSTHFFHTHLFKSGQVCSVCNKAFTGFLKQGLKCEVCQTFSHHHCVSRVSVCPRVVQEGRRLTFSKRKVIASVEDLDEFDQFLLEKVGALQGSDDGGVGEAFKVTLTQFHTSIIASLSLQIQPSVEAEGSSDADSQASAGEVGRDEMSATFDQLVVQFTHIIKRVSKTYGLHESHRQVIILQLKGFLDEFCNTKGSKKRNIKRRYSQVPVIRDSDSQKAKSISSTKVVQEHKGHQFVTQMFNVVTVCELCDKQIAVLTPGMVCNVCTYTCHETCHKKVNRKCKSKHSDQLKTIDEEEAMRALTIKQKTQFGVSLKKLVPGRVVRVPVVLERLVQHVETYGLLTQGIYRKNPSPSNKLALKEALDKDPLGTPLEEYHIHAAASLIKTFFHELPHPLLTFEMYREFMLCTELSDPAQKLHTIHQLIARLPVLSHCILERLVFHLARVAQNESTNLMGPENLAIIFAPSLFRPKKPPKPQDLVKELAKAQDVLTVVISDQLERLNCNLQSIVLVSTAAASTANQLHELIERESKEPTPEVDAVCRSPSPGDPCETTVEQLAVELESLERERAELTAQLPKLEPFKSFPSLEDLTLSYSDEDRSLTPTSSSSMDSSLLSTPSDPSPRHRPHASPMVKS